MRIILTEEIIKFFSGEFESDTPQAEKLNQMVTKPTFILNTYRQSHSLPTGRRRKGWSQGFGLALAGRKGVYKWELDSTDEQPDPDTLFLLRFQTGQFHLSG